jgi:hypothetical protein
VDTIEPLGFKIRMEVTQEIFEKLLVLLKHPDIETLRQAIESVGVLKWIPENAPVWEFGILGFDVFLYESKPESSMLFLHFASPRIVNGAANAYRGYLPFGLDAQDNRTAVAKKVLVKLQTSSIIKGWDAGQKRHKDSYCLDSLIWSFSFDAETQKLLLISINRA